MTVAELLGRIGSDELTEWMAYDAIDPFGDQRADLRAGIVASTTANIWRAKDSKPVTPKDFMPFTEDAKPKPQTPNQMRMMAKLYSLFGMGAKGKV